jgi:hypothetical protein
MWNLTPPERRKFGVYKKDCATDAKQSMDIRDTLKMMLEDARETLGMNIRETI